MILVNISLITSNQAAMHELWNNKNMRAFRFDFKAHVITTEITQIKCIY